MRKYEKLLNYLSDKNLCGKTSLHILYLIFWTKSKLKRKCLNKTDFRLSPLFKIRKRLWCTNVSFALFKLVFLFKEKKYNSCNICWGCVPTKVTVRNGMYLSNFSSHLGVRPNHLHICPSYLRPKWQKNNSLDPQMHLHSQGVPTPRDKVFV